MLVGVENLTAETSFWMKPYKGVPLARIISPFDIVYLDEDLRVVGGMELSPAIERAQFECHAASALVLPLHTVYSSRTYPGDQLIICAAEELVRHLASVPVGGVPVSVHLNGKPFPEQPRRSGSPGPVLVDDQAGKRQAPIQPPDPEERAEFRPVQETKTLEFQAEEIDAVISQVRSWSAAVERPRAPVPFVPLPAPAWQNREFAATENHGHNGAKSTLLPDRPRRNAPPIQRFDEIEEVEIQSGELDGPIDPSSQAIESVISQVLRWAEETGRPPATASLAAHSASSAARSVAPPAERSGGNDGLASANSTDRSDGQRTAIERGDGDARQARGKDSWITRLLRSVDALMHPHSAHGLRSASRTQNGARSSTEQPSDQRVLTVPVKRPGVETERSNVKAKARPVSQYFHSMRILFARWLESGKLTPTVLGPIERRRSRRHPLPGLVAYYWTGGTPKAHQVGDISTTGFYLLTDERWVPDTLIRVTLQRQGTQGSSPEDVISVVSKVVRWGENGVGYEFVPSETLELTGQRVRNGHRFA